MAEIYLVGFDGSAGSHGAVGFAMRRAKVNSNGAELHLAYIIEWSPYSFLTLEELEQRHRDKETELRRGYGVIVEPMLAEIRAEGLVAQGIARHGHAAQILCDLARELRAVQIFIGRQGSSELHARVFGSVPSTLVQIAPVPVTVVP